MLAIVQMPCAYFISGSFQILNSTTEWNTNYFCLSHPQLHMPPTACKIERMMTAKKQDFASLIGTWCLLVYSIPGSSQNFMRMAVLSCLWKPKSRVSHSAGAGKLCLLQKQDFCLCKKPAPSCSPGRAPQQHVCWALNRIPPPFSLRVTYVKYCFSSKLFSETFWSLFSTEWSRASPVKVNGCLSSAD